MEWLDIIISGDKIKELIIKMRSKNYNFDLIEKIIREKLSECKKEENAKWVK